MKIKRNVLLNPGPATTTDTVKLAQVVPDICPREEEFISMMKNLQEDLIKIVHGNPDEYTAVLFCGSGTINMDICLNSLLPEGKKILIINNGAYSSRAVEICRYYGLPFFELKIPVNERPQLEIIEKVLKADSELELVYITHNETGTGLLNPISQIGELVHHYQRQFIVDTTSTYAMIPIDVSAENIDFCMASAQKGLMAMTGLSFIIGKREAIVKSKDYPKRSYYCNLYLQYEYFEKTGQMHFTPPVQTIYAARKALNEYFQEGELEKWNRHKKTNEAIHAGLQHLGFHELIRFDWQSGLVVAVEYPDDVNWDFGKIHDYCYECGFTIYPGKIDGNNTFRLCSLGAINTDDIREFFKIFEEALKLYDIKIPVLYQNNIEK